MKVSEVGPRYHVSKTLSLKPTNTVFIPLIKPIPDEIPDEIEAAAVFSRPGGRDKPLVITVVTAQTQKKPILKKVLLTST